MLLTPTEKVAVAGMVVAAYGAVLSTVNSVIQYLGHRRDRADVVLTVRQNMTTDSPPYAGMSLTVITAANRGKRPVRIEGFAARQVDRKKQFILVDIRPAIPARLEESQSVSAYADEADNALSNVETYYVWDSVGRMFSYHLRPWYRRAVSKYRRRFSPKMD